MRPGGEPAPERASEPQTAQAAAHSLASPRLVPGVPVECVELGVSSPHHKLHPGGSRGLESKPAHISLVGRGLSSC